MKPALESDVSSLDGILHGAESAERKSCTVKVADREAAVICVANGRP